MALFNKIKNIFKKSEKKKAKKTHVAGAKHKQVRPPQLKDLNREIVKKTPLKKRAGEVYRILKEPHISEKSTQLSDEGKYTFKVFSRANKVEIKKAIGDLYGVRVKNVRTINIKPKNRTLRGHKGEKPGYKKAIVVLEQGEKIEILPH